MKNKTKKIIVKILAITLIVVGMIGVCGCIMVRDIIPQEIYPLCVLIFGGLPIAGVAFLIL